jgi:hypothetical protein
LSFRHRAHIIFLKDWAVGLFCRWIITAFAVNNPPHAAFGVLRVAIAPRDQMNVGMKHRLSGRCTDVCPNIEPGNQRVSLPDVFDKGADQCFTVADLLPGQAKPVGRVPQGNDQQVAVGYRETVVEGGNRAEVDK